MPLTVSTLQYPLPIILADDDAMPWAEVRDDAQVIIRRFMVFRGAT